MLSNKEQSIVSVGNRRRLTEFLNLPKTILRKNILIVIMSFRDRSPMEMEKDILLYR